LVCFDEFGGMLDFLEVGFVLVVKLVFCVIFQKGNPSNVVIVFVGEDWGKKGFVVVLIVGEALNLAVRSVHNVYTVYLVD